MAMSTAAAPLAAVLCLLQPLLAQLPGGATQDPTPAPARSPAEKIGDLQRELERLQKEIEFVKERSKDSAGILRSRLQQRAFAPRSIDAGTNTTIVTPPTPIEQPRPARRMTSVELEKFQGDVLMVVEGRPIRAGEFDGLMAYLAKDPTSGDEEARAHRVSLELLRIEAVIANFPDTAAEAHSEMSKAAAELAEGKPFAEVQNRYGRGPNIANEGKIEIRRFSPWGLEIEQAAFTTEVGKVVGPVRGMSGYAVLAVDKVTTSDQDAGDVVEARMIFMPYHEDAVEMDQVRSRALSGKIDLIVRDKETFAKLPAAFRPMDVSQPNRDFDTDIMTPDRPKAPQDQPRGPEKKKG